MKVYMNGKVPVKCWCENPEQGAIDQAVDVSNHPAVFHHVALAPDTHQGYGLPIGGITALDGCVSPYMVGVDIACGMMACKTNIKADEISEENLKKIVNQIKRDVPVGYRRHNHQKKDEIYTEKFDAIEYFWTPELNKVLNVSYNKNGIEEVLQQCGTLGGGNHFLELQKDEKGFLWIMIHSGSRNIGKKVCEYFHKIAQDNCKKWHSDLHTDRLAFLPVDSVEGKAYLECMEFCVDFSFLNREYMLKNIKYAIGRYIEKDIKYAKAINIHHNYAALENHFGKNVWVHRKGATSAKKNEIGIIPGSMGTHSYIVKGKGNKDSFMSCSHGAGRCMGRKEAERTFTLDEFKSKMNGIVSTDVNNAHIDESPMAYKDISIVMKEQNDLIDIVHELSPIANCKG